MTIEKKINGEEATLIISGRLDTQTAPELENELEEFNVFFCKIESVLETIPVE